jgi:hypothetical protein
MKEVFTVESLESPAKVFIEGPLKYRSALRIAALTVGVLFLLSCGDSQPSGPLAGVISEAEKHFLKIAASDEDLKQLLGMSEVRVFGRGSYLGYTLVGEMTARKIQDNPETFEVTVPFWCSGKDQGGRFQKISHELRVWVLRDKASQWKIEKHELGTTRPLSVRDQLQPWIKWVLLSYLLVVPLALLTFVMAESGFVKLLGVVGIIMALDAAFRSSFVCLGSSDLGIVGGILGYIAGLNLIVFLVLAKLR